MLNGMRGRRGEDGWLGLARWLGMLSSHAAPASPWHDNLYSAAQCFKTISQLVRQSVSLSVWSTIANTIHYTTDGSEILRSGGCR